MTTPRELLARYTSQSQMSSFFIDKMGIVNVKSYGAKGDGVTDDSEALKSAIASLPKNGGKLFFPTGVYIHGDGVTTGFSYPPVTIGVYDNCPSGDTDMGRDIRLMFDGYTNLTISGYGATIQSHDNNGECRNNSIFTFINCGNLRVEGIKIDARSQFRIPVLSDYDDGSGKASRSNLFIRYGTNITLEDVESNYSMMDGVFISGDSTAQADVRLINCNCYYNYRQGLTISSVKKCLVDGGNYSFTGVLRGTMPKSGIDIEADAFRNTDVIIRGATIDSNAVSGIVLSYRSSNCKIEKCKFINKGVNSVYDNTCENNEITGNTFINCGIWFYQYGLKCTKNIFLIDTISTAYLLSFEGTQPKIDGKLDIFEDNTILCDLTNITLTDRGYVGGIQFAQERLISFKRNIIKNSYSKTEVAGYNIWLKEGCYAEDNQIIFDYIGANVHTTSTLYIFGSRIKNNTITGYASPQMKKFINPYGGSSDFRTVKSFGYVNKVNSLYSINWNYSGTIKAVIQNGGFAEYTIAYDGSAGIATCYLKSKRGTDPICNVYKKSPYIYIEVLSASVILSLDLIPANSSQDIDPFSIVPLLDTTTDIGTLTLISNALQADSTAVDVVTLKTDFNALLAKMRISGLV